MKKIYDETEERKGRGEVDGLYDASCVYLTDKKPTKKGRSFLSFKAKRNKKMGGGGGERGVCVYVRTRQTKWRHTQQYPPHY